MTARRLNKQDDEAPSIGGAAVAGALATYGMDVVGRTILAPALKMKPPGNLGRWIGHMAQGRFTHEDITKAVPVAHEATIAVTAHYAIGLILGAGYALLLRVLQPRQSTLTRAAAYGAATTVFPWFGCSPLAARASWDFATATCACPRSRSALTSPTAWASGSRCDARMRGSRNAVGPCWRSQGSAGMTAPGRATGRRRLAHVRGLDEQT